MVKTLSPALRISWALANNEAQIAGDELIRPVHFLLGILKVGDASTVSDVLDDSISTEDHTLVMEDARRIRQFLEMTDEQLQKTRKTLRIKVRANGIFRIEDEILHRSRESKAAFQHAAELASNTNEDSLSATHFLRALFDCGFIDTTLLSSN